MRARLQPAYLLHRRPYRESSQLLELLTVEHGRVGALARGLRRRSRGGAAGALLQPFAPLLVSLRGRGELKSLSAVETAGGLLPLRGDALLSAFYVNELLMRLLQREEAQPAIFRAYALALGALADGDEIEPVLRRFECLLLRELGYGFAFDRDAVSGERVRPEGRYRFEPGLGLRPAPLGDASGSVSGEHLLRIAADDFGDGAGRVAKRLLRRALAELLGGRPLSSRQLFLRRRAPGR